MSLKDRDTLKKLFRKGSKPTEAGFSDFIDSSINKIDDGIDKTLANGLKLAPLGDSKKVISLYQEIQDQSPEWSLDLTNDPKNGKAVYLDVKPADNNQPVIRLTQDGKVGINKGKPRRTLDVNGIVSFPTRAGSYAKASEVAADGEWHTIIEGLNYCNAFEIVARTGILNSGRHAILHAYALSAYGNSHSKIRCSHARFSFWRPLKIRLRWTGSTHNYNLEMRSSRDLGAGKKIKYYITQLWDDEQMGIPLQFSNIKNS